MDPKRHMEIFLNPKRHMETFLNMCEIHLVEHDDLMVIIFLQTLTRLAYEWYVSLLAISISSFDDLEAMLLIMYAPLVSYHTFITQFT